MVELAFALGLIEQLACRIWRRSVPWEKAAGRIEGKRSRVDSAFERVVEPLVGEPGPVLVWVPCQ